MSRKKARDVSRWGAIAVKWDYGDESVATGGGSAVVLLNLAVLDPEIEHAKSYL